MEVTLILFAYLILFNCRGIKLRSIIIEEFNKFSPKYMIDLIGIRINQYVLSFDVILLTKGYCFTILYISSSFIICP